MMIKYIMVCGLCTKLHSVINKKKIKMNLYLKIKSYLIKIEIFKLSLLMNENILGFPGYSIKT